MSEFHLKPFLPGRYIIIHNILIVAPHRRSRTAFMRGDGKKKTVGHAAAAGTWVGVTHICLYVSKLLLLFGVGPRERRLPFSEIPRTIVFFPTRRHCVSV